jgi:hypothetical protein
MRCDAPAPLDVVIRAEGPVSEAPARTPLDEVIAAIHSCRSVVSAVSISSGLYLRPEGVEVHRHPTMFTATNESFRGHRQQKQ